MDICDEADDPMTQEHPIFTKGRQGVRIDVTDVAVLIRGRLKAMFPGQKFSVTCSRFSGGGTDVYVRWDGGPSAVEVRPVLDGYNIRGFDAMTDSTIHRDLWLHPDGSPGTKDDGARKMDCHGVGVSYRRSMD
jgi:hypothetical protein